MAIGMGLSAQSCSTATSGTPGQPPAVTATLGPLALGVNTAAWDSLYTSANADDVDRELRVAGMHLLRYPGGSWSDEYDWDTNTDTSKCGGPPTSACTSPDPLGFDAFASNKVAINLYEKTGFRETGRIPKGVYRNGIYIDLVRMTTEL